MGVCRQPSWTMLQSSWCHEEKEQPGGNCPRDPWGQDWFTCVGQTHCGPRRGSLGCLLLDPHTWCPGCRGEADEHTDWDLQREDGDCLGPKDQLEGERAERGAVPPPPHCSAPGTGPRATSAGLPARTTLPSCTWRALSLRARWDAQRGLL